MNLYTRAALGADILSLGPHWVYDQAQLAALYPNGVREPTDPAAQWHTSRKAGQYTHYGDQTRWLAECIATNGGQFDRGSWRTDWTRHMSSYDGYVDGASQTTLASDGASPSGSSDLGGAARIAPILDIEGATLDDSINAARAQTTLTHGAPIVADIAEFMVRATLAISETESFRAAFNQAAEQGSYAALDPASDLARATAADSSNALAAASELGVACDAEGAFPCMLYFALQNEASDLATAVSNNGLAGGDTSARSMLFALLFAARDGDAGME